MYYPYMFFLLFSSSDVIRSRDRWYMIMRGKTPAMTRGDVFVWLRPPCDILYAVRVCTHITRD